MISHQKLSCKDNNVVRSNTCSQDFGNMSFEELRHHDIIDCDFRYEMSEAPDFKMSSPSLDVSNPLSSSMNGSGVYGTFVKDIPMCTSLSSDLNMSLDTAWSDFVRQGVNGPTDVGAVRMDIQSQTRFVATHELPKLVESGNVTSSGISNNGFSNVYGHGWRPAKRPRLSNQETVHQCFATNNNLQLWYSNTPYIVTTNNVMVSSEDNLGLESKKKDVVSSGSTKSEPTECLTKRLDDTGSLTGLEEPKKVGVSLIDGLTADELQEHILSFGKVTDEVDDPCQLCDMNKILLNPVPIYCTYCCCRIKKNLLYYWTTDEMGGKHYFCGPCFRNSKGDSVSIQGLSFYKSDFLKEKNVEEVEETWVQCDMCERWQHQICALYNSGNDPEGTMKYICPCCRLHEIKIGEHMPLCAPFGAEDLPRTKLSDHIEQRLHRRLKEERRERAMSSGKCVAEVPGAENLVVRVVVSANKLVKVKQQFLDIFHGRNYPSEFPYTSKMILLFQKIKGVDVCLYAMYVQEYGSDCPTPNRRAVYISYIDSVNHFQPQIRTVHGEALRTFVYHEILIGYLHYCKNLGFESCYIWACPPLKSEDYILNCHPEYQKNPKSDKLRNWYKSMLLKAADENIVVDTTNFYNRFFVPNAHTKVTTANLPYFDGAYWAGAAEDLYMRFDKERRGSAESTKNLMSKRALKSMGHNNLSGESKADIVVMQKLGQVISPVKEDFMIVHLQFCCSSCHKFILPPNHWCCTKCKSFRVCPTCINTVQRFCKKTHFINGKDHSLSQIVVSGVPESTDDEDVVLDNDIFENRNSFLSFCQKRHYQFDSLRRAKYSSMMILHHLHKHEPTQRSCITDNGTDNNRSQKQKPALKMEELLKAVVHAVQCKHSKENPCSNTKCCKLRNIFNHTRQCQRRVTGGCKLCKMTWALLQLHSRNCGVADCQVPRCQDIKMARHLKTTQAGNFRGHL